MRNIYEVADANKRKSTLIIILFVLFVTLAIYMLSQAMGFYMGYEPGGLGLVGMAMIVSGIMSFAGYYYSDKIILGISGARQADRTRNFEFYTIAENLSIAAGVPKPRLYTIEDTAMNAFATGRDPDHAVICATTGLLETLNRTELEGVIAHELTHVKNYDIRLMSVVSVLVGVVALLGDWFMRMSWFGRNRDSDRDSGQIGALFLVLGIVFALLSPIVAQLIQLAISRRREFMADAGSVELTRQPSGLISALEKISQDTEVLEAANKATAHLFIENPFKEKSKSAVGWFAGLFNTHPPVTQRIKELQSMV
jgi:heat shock protein HtpX